MNSARCGYEIDSVRQVRPQSGVSNDLMVYGCGCGQDKEANRQGARADDASSRRAVSI
jgi:hypothetical protein